MILVLISKSNFSYKDTHTHTHTHIHQSQPREYLRPLLLFGDLAIKQIRPRDGGEVPPHTRIDGALILLLKEGQQLPDGLNDVVDEYGCVWRPLLLREGFVFEVNDFGKCVRSGLGGPEDEPCEMGGDGRGGSGGEGGGGGIGTVGFGFA